MSNTCIEKFFVHIVEQHNIFSFMMKEDREDEVIIL